MARLPRLVIPELAHHVVLRGINRMPLFADAADCQALLDILAQQLKAKPIALHGYVLLDSRIDLLLTPGDAHVLSLLMQGLGRSYVRHFNQRHGRFGTLWEGRFRAGPMQPAPYVLATLTFMDWLPVTEGRVTEPRDYPWSSYRRLAGLEPLGMLTPHPLYWQLADTPFGREAAYQALVAAGIGSALTGQIEKSAMGGWLLGSTSFVEELSQKVARRLGPGRPGRPRKN